MTKTLDLNGEMLRRIVALLLSLAVLAERAAARPLAVRVMVFWILRRAELGARTLFVKTAGPLDAEAPFMGPPHYGAGIEPNDLLRLAASFRAIATLLSLTGWAAAAPDIGESAGAAQSASSPRDLARRFGPVPKINDTS